MLDLSICIVTLNCSLYLRNCLRSIFEQSAYLTCVDANSSFCAEHSSRESGKIIVELTVVDNGSTDETIKVAQTEFPQARLIQNGKNDGFSKPLNQAMHASAGRYMLILNPDTVILPGALNSLVEYMDSHPEAGVCGPKVLNRDGSLQKACKRGDSRPWAAISYFSGLSSLFPRSKFFGRYLLNYLDENETNEVDGVSGSCMLIRKEVLEQVGYLDERYFAYQEDADYCFQVRKAGWKVIYHPQAQIIHYGGHGGSRVQPYRSIYEWHRSYYLYYQKNLAKDYLFIFNWLYYVLMGLKLTISLIANALRSEKYAGPRRAGLPPQE